jgi:hypothetical protein
VKQNIATVFGAKTTAAMMPVEADLEVGPVRYGWRRHRMSNHSRNEGLQFGG